MNHFVREPAVAGTFYPAEKTELEKMLNVFLEGERPKIQGKIRALLVPHAGYIYSGPVAGKAFRLLPPAKKETKVILLGPAHTRGFPGASVSRMDAWQTPLGNVAIHPDSKRIIGPEIQNIEEAHFQEHCLEVQLPFLQMTLGKFSIVPIIAGMTDPTALSKEIEKMMGRDDLLVISSDLSHYLAYAKAKETDQKTIKAIMDLDVEEMDAIGDACGKTPILTLIEIAKKKKWTPRLLDYCNSGDTAGDPKRVVGYAAMVFSEESK